MKLLCFIPFLFCTLVYGQANKPGLCNLSPVTGYTASTASVPIVFSGTQTPTATGVNLPITIAGVTTPAAMNGNWTMAVTSASHNGTLTGSSSMTGTFSGSGSTIFIYKPPVECFSSSRMAVRAQAKRRTKSCSLPPLGTEFIWSRIT
jgi:hypothetical protein